MPATTISPRLILADDSGTPSAPVGDGDVWDNAQLQALQAKVEGLIANDITFGGLVHSEGVGNHIWSGSSTAGNQLTLRNTNSGTAAFAQFRIGNDATDAVGTLTAFSSTFVPAGDQAQDGVRLNAVRAGGLTLSASHASGVVRAFAGGTNKYVNWSGDALTLKTTDAGDRTVPSRIDGSVNTTSVGTDANTTPKTLHSFTLPASTLGSDGQAVKIVAFGSLAANSQTKTVRVKFGATVIGDWDASGSGTSGGGWRIEGIVVRTGAATQKAICSVGGRTVSNPGAAFAWDAGGTASGTITQYTTPAETLSATVSVEIEGENGTASANDIVCAVSYITLT